MQLKKPDTNTPVFDILPGTRENVQYGRCPCCKKIVNTGDVFGPELDPANLSSPFRNDISRKEYSVSGLCQDEVFGID